MNPKEVRRQETIVSVIPSPATGAELFGTITIVYAGSHVDLPWLYASPQLYMRASRVRWYLI
jgi:hypothetical protein